MYQSHQVLDSLCSLSLLAPWLPQLTQTVNEVHKTTRLVSAIVDIQQCTPSKKNKTQNIKTHRKSDCNLSPCAEKSSQLLSHFRSPLNKNQPKHAKIKNTEFTFMVIVQILSLFLLHEAVEFWVLLVFTFKKTKKETGDTILYVGQKWSHTWEDSNEYLPAALPVDHVHVHNNPI